MNRLAVLLHKEWRDHRALLLIGAVLAPLASRLAQWAGGLEAEDLTGGYVLPAIMLPWLSCLAADLVAKDGEASVEDTLSRLPIAAPALLAAKFLFLAVSAGCAAAWVVGAECLWRTVSGQPVEGLLGVLRSEGPWLALACGTSLAFGLGVAFRRSLPAAVLALGLTAFVPYALRGIAEKTQGPQHDLTTWLAWMLDRWPDWVAFVVVITVVLTVLIVYRPGRWSRVQNAVLFVLVAVVPALGMNLGFEWVRRVDGQFRFGEESAGLKECLVDPSGRWLALRVIKSSMRTVLSTWFLVDLESGESFRTGPDSSDAGLCWINPTWFVQFRDRQTRSVRMTNGRWVEGIWGDASRENPFYDTPSGYYSRTPQNLVESPVLDPLGFDWNRDTDELTVTAPNQRGALHLSGVTGRYGLGAPGEFLTMESDLPREPRNRYSFRLMHYDFAAGSGILLASNLSGTLQLSPDERYVHVSGRSGCLPFAQHRWIDLESGESVTTPKPMPSSRTYWVWGRMPGTIALGWSYDLGQDETHFFSVGGTPIELAVSGRVSCMAQLAQGNLLLMLREPSFVVEPPADSTFSKERYPRIWIVNPEGEFVRSIYPPSPRP